jgi:hypothetical protein
MISNIHLENNTQRIREAVEAAFDLAQSNEARPNDFILFLANGYYEQSFENNVNSISPYVIDGRLDIYKDIDRQKFYVGYINSNSWRIIEKIEDKDKRDFMIYTTSIEMMIYAHIWESKWLLKILKQLANLTNGVNYNWKIGDQIPANRNTFIRNDIANFFRARGLDLAAVIDESYSSQLRNAFAHSDYSFHSNYELEGIDLWNHKQNNPLSIPLIDINDWHERFAKSLILAHTLLEVLQLRRKSLPLNNYEIIFPDYLNNGIDSIVKIHYNPENDYFNFVH